MSGCKHLTKPVMNLLISSFFIIPFKAHKNKKPQAPKDSARAQTNSSKHQAKSSLPPHSHSSPTLSPSEGLKQAKSSLPLHSHSSPPLSPPKSSEGRVGK